LASVIYIMPVSTSRYELLQKRLSRFASTLDGFDKGDVRALHRVRVTSRRLRELLPVLQLDSHVTVEIGRRLRKVTRRIGPSRELDVLASQLETLRQSGRYDEESLSRVASAIAQRRAAAREHLVAKLPVTDLHRIASKLGKIADELVAIKAEGTSRSATRGWRWAVGARLGRRSAALKTAVQDAGAMYLPERLHAVRIAVKKLRYVVELESEVSGTGKHTLDLRTLRRNQERLGRLHDRQVLIDQVRQVQASSTPPDIGVWRRLDALVAMLENECRRLHARFLRDSGALLAVCDRVSGPTPTDAARRAG
jgi:CHAD domain-containing protein